MDSERHYCTFFDSRYFYKGILAYESLRAHSSKPIVFWVLCLDEQVYQKIDELHLPGIRPVRLQTLEQNDPQLAKTKETRTDAEYYFTCTPCFPHYILNNFSGINDITYIDADLYFFSDAEAVYRLIGDQSIAITPHRFPAIHAFRVQWGIYNVAFNFFRKDSLGMKCLEWWRSACLEWCYDRIESGKFADQKYLDDWPSRFQGVRVLSSPGINLAPWNVQDAYLRSSNIGITVDGQKLVFYHFHGFTHVTGNFFNPHWGPYQVKPDRVLRSEIYQRYADEYRTLMCRTPVVSDLAPNERSSPEWKSDISVTSLYLNLLKGRYIYARPAC